MSKLEFQELKLRYNAKICFLEICFITRLNPLITQFVIERRRIVITLPLFLIFILAVVRQHCLYITWWCVQAALNWPRIFSSLSLLASIMSKEMHVRVEVVQGYVIWKWKLTANYENLPKRIEFSIWDTFDWISRMRTTDCEWWLARMSSSAKLLVRRWRICCRRDARAVIWTVQCFVKSAASEIRLEGSNFM